MKILFVVPCYTFDFPQGVGYLCPPLIKIGITPDLFIPEKPGPFEDAFIETLRRTRYDIIGISALYPDFRQVIRLCEIIRAEQPKAAIVLGGILLTCTPEFAMKKTGADIGAIGESEITMRRIAESLRDGTPLGGIKGIIFRTPVNALTRTEPGEIVQNPDDIDPPPWHLFPMEMLISRITNNVRMVYPDTGRAFSVVGSRGCPFNCNFCTRFTTFRQRKIDCILDEVEFLIRTYGIEHFSFDDNLALSGKKKVFEWAEKIHARGLEFTYSLQRRFDSVMTGAVIDALHESGCRMINYGLESADQSILDKMNKQITVDKVPEIVKRTKQAGILTGLTCMFGQPGDNEESLRKTLKMYIEFSDVIGCFTACTPFPGSALFDEAVASGRIKDDEDFFNKFHNMYEISVNLTNMPDEEYSRLISKANLLIYQYKNMRDVLEGKMKIMDFGTDVGELLNMITRFKHWVSRAMREIEERGIRDIAVYGCGLLAEFAVEEARRTGINITAFLDGNHEKHGLMFLGNVIQSPHVLTRISCDAVLITVATDTFITRIKENIAHILTNEKIEIITLIEEIRKFQ